MPFTSKMPPLRYVLLALSIFSLSSAALQKVLLVMRHGDRTIDKALFPTEINSGFYTNGKGEITPLGREEAYDMGLRLRNMYQSFLSNNTDEVRANSSNYSRCIITTGCAIIGMYTPDNNETCMHGTPATGWPVTVNTVLPDKDFVLNSDACDQFKSERDSKNSMQVQANNAYLQEYNVTIEELANYTGYNTITDGSMVFLTYDNLLVEKIHNLTWQYPWVDPMWPDIEAAAYPSYYLEYVTNNSRKLSGGPILNEIVQRINESNNSTKLYIYGTHDSTITPLLLLLGVDNGLPPPYVATVVVELHDNATVRLMYINSTDPPLSLQIPQCDLYCPVDQFVNLTRPFVVTNALQECHNGNAKFTGASISILFCLLVTLFL